MFWTDWGRSVGRSSVERADMDGSNRLLLAGGDQLGWPNGITVDTGAHRVIWTDAKTEVHDHTRSTALCPGPPA